MKTQNFKLIILSFLIYSTSTLASSGIVDPMVFSIEKDGKTSIILGALHTVPLDEFSQPIKDILHGQDTIVMEHGASVEFSQDMFKRGTRERPWIHALSEPAQAFLRDKVPNIKDIGELKIWAAYMAFLTSDFKGMDSQLFEGYTKRGSAYSTLEDNNDAEIAVTLRYLEGSIVGVDVIAEIERAAYYSLTNQESPSARVEKRMIDDYKAGLSLTTFLPHQSVLADRNKVWIPNIDTYHKYYNESVLFAVGCGHLVGRVGILKMLQDIGYVIKKANSDGEFKPFEIPYSWRV